MLTLRPIRHRKEAIAIRLTDPVRVFFRGFEEVGTHLLSREPLFSTKFECLTFQNKPLRNIVNSMSVGVYQISSQIRSVSKDLAA